MLPWHPDPLHPPHIPPLWRFAGKKPCPPAPRAALPSFGARKGRICPPDPPHFGAGHPFPPKLLLPPGLGPRRRAGTAPAPRTWPPSPHHGTTPPAARRTRGGGWPRLGGGGDKKEGASAPIGGATIPPRVCPQVRTDAAHPSHPDSPWLSQQHHLFFLFIYLTILLFIYFFTPTICCWLAKLPQPQSCHFLLLQPDRDRRTRVPWQLQPI